VTFNVFIKQDGMAMQFIKNPTEVVHLVAVTLHKYDIKNIKNPTEAVILAAATHKKSKKNSNK